MDDFAAVLDAAQHGDEAAFTVLFRTFNPALLRYVTVLGGGSAAEDIAAETWIAALRGFTRFTGEERAFRSWLLTIARGRWVDSVRASARRPELVTETVPESPAQEDVHSEVADAMSTARAVELIRQLPADQAEVITLRVIGQLEVTDVADMTGKTPNHVRVLTHRGLRRLAKLLGEKPPEGL